MISLESYVESAWSAGAFCDLDGIYYGFDHSDKNVFSQAAPYYKFLSGVVKISAATRILEIGTHQGGSARALVAGAGGQPVSLLTIDVENNSDGLLLNTPCITRIMANALTPVCISAVAKFFNYGTVDIIYIDADHQFLPTAAMFGIYQSILKPKLVIFDDITLYEDMKAFWEMLKLTYGNNAVDASLIVPAIRPPLPDGRSAGFGVVRFP